MIVYVYEYFTKFVAGVMSCYVGPVVYLYGLIGVVSPVGLGWVSPFHPVGLGNRYRFQSISDWGQYPEPKLFLDLLWRLVWRHYPHTHQTKQNQSQKQNSSLLTTTIIKLPSARVMQPWTTAMQHSR